MTCQSGAGVSGTRCGPRQCHDARPQSGTRPRPEAWPRQRHSTCEALRGTGGGAPSHRVAYSGRHRRRDTQQAPVAWAVAASSAVVLVLVMAQVVSAGKAGVGGSVPPGGSVAVAGAGASGGGGSGVDDSVMEYLKCSLCEVRVGVRAGCVWMRGGACRRGGDGGTEQGVEWVLPVNGNSVLSRRPPAPALPHHADAALDRGH